MQTSCHKAKNRRQHKKLTEENIFYSPSPNTKVKELTKNITVPETIKKRLLFGETVSKQLSTTAKFLKPESKQQQISNKCVSGPLLKKYNMQSIASNFISPKQNKKFSQNKNLGVYDRKSKTVSVHVKNLILQFYEDDRFSKMTLGKNDFETKNGEKSNGVYY